ncbi:hypothetical protein GCM10007082_22610 [Oceanisphaera arctica]|nr:hypothetical protein GCM10007082_22610 [Oceanisphaera arctica]
MRLRRANPGHNNRAAPQYPAPAQLRLTGSPSNSAATSAMAVMISIPASRRREVRGESEYRVASKGRNSVLSTGKPQS